MSFMNFAKPKKLLQISLRVTNRINKGIDFTLKHPEDEGININLSLDTLTYQKIF